MKQGVSLFTFYPISEPPKRGHHEDNVTTSTPTASNHSHSSLAHRAMESFNNKVQSLSTKLPKKAWQEEVVSDDEGIFKNQNIPIFSSPGCVKQSKPINLTHVLFQNSGTDNFLRSFAD